jgi:hypothetical protein
VTDTYEFPTAIEDESESQRDTLRWAVRVVALSTLGLALLNPGAIDGWVSDLPPGPVTVRLAAMTRAWQETASRVGLGTGHERMHAAWKAAERADWSGRQPVETADASSPRS